MNEAQDEIAVGQEAEEPGSNTPTVIVHVQSASPGGPLSGGVTWDPNTRTVKMDAPAGDLIVIFNAAADAVPVRGSGQQQRGPHRTGTG